VLIDLKLKNVILTITSTIPAVSLVFRPIGNFGQKWQRNWL